MRHNEQVITKREKRKVLFFLKSWREGELKHNAGRTDGLKMKSLDLFEHYEDREQEEGRQK